METNTPLNTPENPNQTPFKINSQTRWIVLVIVISLVCGSLGGAAGTFYLLKQPAGQKLLGGQGSGFSQNITINQDSGIIDVVKKDSPAVVSIVVSQDLSKIPGYSLDPFSQSPFDFFFGGGSGGSDGSGGDGNSGDGSGQQPDQQAPSDGSGLQEIAAGSGFFVSADGLILTNKHVVSDNSASYTVLTSDGKTYDAKVLAQDPSNDLAIVKINIQHAPFLSLADSSSVQTGQPVIAIGNSLGQYQNTVTAGIISGIGRNLTAGGSDGSSEDLSGVIQTDAAINPGNSGGPLLNITGQVVGINTAIDEQGQLVGFAIPSNQASRDLASYQKNGQITRPFLGVRYIPITQDLADSQNLPENHGALIVRGDTATDFAVQPGSPADKAGLMENDIILSVNGQAIDDNHDLADIIRNFNPGDKISLQVYHKGNIENLTVTLAESK